MKIIIINYGAGNIQSIQFALQRLGYEGVLSNNIQEIQSADKVIFPGVGEASSAMKKLRESGLDKIIPALKQPVLGICLGMQLLFSSGEEYGTHEGLGIVPGSVVRFEPREGFKVPHMGWNRLTFMQGDSPLLEGLEEGHVYFVHSYHALVEQESDLIAVTDYGFPVTAIVGRGNVFGMQFHPEKSGELGMQLLGNFLKLKQTAI